MGRDNARFGEELQRGQRVSQQEKLPMYRLCKKATSQKHRRFYQNNPPLPVGGNIRHSNGSPEY